ncbi:hypothetical protein IO99_05000 [Clostridium sulfidigenes]|uniref:Galactoside O-acetyltransferase n=1 Tax=Clostridium sulfidigenes TaxID=318464 RepID=A0A084JF94_9CLOT|nr:acyltransferase [Clostridium sulfidigenes]KEZ87628.1 hypothetical protein IO99_05000 [Clostridium sulfidigenes]HAR84937.1 acyltransferase [Clostridium sp.]
MRRLYLIIRAIPKTIYFNFKYLPFKKAIKLPIIVSHRVWLMKSRGNVNINSNVIKPAMIKLGFGEVGIFDSMRSRSVWNVSGTVNFSGTATLGHGIKVSVEDEGKLNIGNNLIVTAESSIICRREISLGENVMISWQAQIMDSDLHPIINSENIVINKDEPIDIGDNSWIGSRVILLKGVKLPKGTIVAAGSTLNKGALKSIKEKENSLIGGEPIRILKENVTFKV